MPVANVTADTRITAAWGNSVADAVTGLEGDSDWQSVTYRNNWVDYPNTYHGVRYVARNGIVQLQGLAYNAVGETAGAGILDLPATYLPKYANITNGRLLFMVPTRLVDTYSGAADASTAVQMARVNLVELSGLPVLVMDGAVDAGLAWASFTGVSWVYA